MTIQGKATEDYVPGVLFIMLYKVVLTVESVDEILKCDDSKETITELFKNDCLNINGSKMFNIYHTYTQNH